MRAARYILAAIAGVLASIFGVAAVELAAGGEIGAGATGVLIAAGIGAGAWRVAPASSGAELRESWRSSRHERAMRARARRRVRAGWSALDAGKKAPSKPASAGAAPPSGELLAGAAIDSSWRAAASVAGMIAAIGGTRGAYRHARRLALAGKRETLERRAPAYVAARRERRERRRP